MTNAVLFSGGKDSNLSCHKAIARGALVDPAITLGCGSEEGRMFHWSNMKFAARRAHILGVRQVFAQINGEKWKESDDLGRARAGKRGLLYREGKGRRRDDGDCLTLIYKSRH